MDTGDIYLQACLKALRADTTLFPEQKVAAASCLIMPDDRPAPNAGYLFIGLRLGDQSTVSQPAKALHDKIAIKVAISVRTTDIPTDRVGNNRYSTTDTTKTPRLTVNEIKEQVTQVLHQNDTVLGYAQDLIETDSHYPILTPLSYSSGSGTGPRVVGPEHYQSNNPESTNKGRNDSGLLLILTFSGGERYRLW